MREPPILRFEKVTVAYDNVPAIDCLDLEIPPGESRIILGAAGSGKTVLLKTALGLIRPDSGRVLLFGEDISRMREQDLYDLRARAGILFQEGGLFDSLTIEDNVAYPLRNQRRQRRPPETEILERVEETLSFVGLEHTLEKFPSELSGGMRRRVGIARAVVTEPALVLYDSPTAGLDPITANTIIALLIKERDVKKTTTVMATHRYQDGQLLANFRYNPSSGELEPARSGANLDGNRFLVLKDGRLVFDGTQAELEASNDSYVSKFVMR
ncbi:MAG TPA: organic solvent resistance ABC transporter ATP-binding protein [Solibacterales bacterium]|nr:organic solvent resistance ABC transporter ATP-binding protein [Bryobacterales bacterium]